MRLGRWAVLMSALAGCAEEPPVTESSETLTAPALQRGGLLGSEVNWVVARAAVTTHGAAIARAGRENAALVVVRDNGVLEWTFTGAFRLPWGPPAGCTGITSTCYRDYRPVGETTTFWHAPISDSTTRRHRLDTGPALVTDRAGRLHGFAARTAPSTGITRLRQTGTSMTTFSVSELSGATPVALSASSLGGVECAATTPSVLVVAWYPDRSFRLFQCATDAPTCSERTLAGGTQTSEVAPGLESFGVGDRMAALFYRQAGAWKARYLKPDGATLAGLSSEAALGVKSSSAPQLVYQPGGTMHLITQDNLGLLYGAQGYETGDGFTMPTPQRITDVGLISGYRAFAHGGDAVIVGNSVGTVLAYRSRSEDDPSSWERMGSLRAPGQRGDVGPVVVGADFYVTTTSTSGDVDWLSFARVLARDEAARRDIHLWVNPNMGLPLEAVGSVAALGQALFAMPEKLRWVFARSPGECHPQGWQHPLACGKTLGQLDDYWGAAVNLPEGQFASLATALATLDDADPNTGWDLLTSKGFPGNFVLKSGVDKTITFHELMHEVDMNVIDGTPASPNQTELQRALQAEFTAQFITSRSSTVPNTGDGVRALGYATDYGEKNYHEDWADTLMMYRFRGDTLRQRVESDNQQGSGVLAGKVSFVRSSVFAGREFNDAGAPRAGNRHLWTLYKAAWNDYVTLSNPAAVVAEVGNGACLKIDEGAISQEFRPGRVPLKRWARSDNGGEQWTTSASATSISGYTLVGIEGWVYPTMRAGTRELRRYYNTSSRDHLTTSDPDLQASALANGYIYRSSEGWFAP